MENIRPSSDLRNHYSEVSSNARESREPIFITVNGREDTVIMNSATFRGIQARLELYDILARAEEDVRNGDVMPFCEGVDALRKELEMRWMT